MISAYNRIIQPLLLFTVAIIVLLAPAGANAQGDEHVTLAGHLDTGYASDCWGYTDPNTGIDYALVGNFEGTSIIDASSDPSNPVLVGFIDGPNNGWRDIKTWSNYAYIVTEGGGGMQIIDLTDPTNAVLVNTFSQTFSSAHNLFIDENGFAYVVGTLPGGSGFHILDLSDPVNPIDVGAWHAYYIHDVYVRNDTAWASLIYNGSTAVIDVSDKSNPSTIMTWQSGPATHQCWLTDDGNYLLTTEERVGGHMKIWDVRDLDSITLVSEYESMQNLIIHNAYVKGDFAYLSYYVEGMKIIDISDPENPGEVGDFDTFNGPNSTGFGGSWGVFPFSSSGILYVSDESTGFWSAVFDGIRAAHLKGTVTEVGTGLPIQDARVTFEETGQVTYTDGSGLFRYATADDSVDISIAAYGYEPSSEVIALMNGDTTFYSARLSELSRGSIVGNVTAEGNGTPISATVTLFVESGIVAPDELVTTTDAAGTYRFDDIYVTSEPIVWYSGLIIEPEMPFVDGEEQEEITVNAGSTTNLDFTLGIGDVLLVNDDPSSDYINYYDEALGSLGLTYHRWTVSQKGVVETGAASKLNYPVIIWFTGDATSSVLSQAEQDSITAFLDAGGLLFLTGQNIVESLATSSALLNDYLRLSYSGRATDAAARFVAGNPVTDGLPLFGLTGGNGANNQNSMDILTPSGEASPALYYGMSGDAVAGVTVESGALPYRIFFTGFGFEGMNDTNPSLTSRVLLMERVMTWFGVPVSTGTFDRTPLDARLPSSYTLNQNYPNPFNPVTRIEFGMPIAGSVKLAVYNLLGRKVKTLVDGELPAGIHETFWDGREAFGSKTASGIYFYRLEAPGVEITRKLILMR